MFITFTSQETITRSGSILKRKPDSLELREKFNSGVKYKGLALKWDTAILEKTNQLASYLTSRSPELDFSQPSPVLERADNLAIRETILGLSHSQAKKRGIEKSTLHYLRDDTPYDRPFRISHMVKRKLENVSI